MGLCAFHKCVCAICIKWSVVRDYPHLYRTTNSLNHWSHGSMLLKLWPYHLHVSAEFEIHQMRWYFSNLPLSIWVNTVALADRSGTWCDNMATCRIVLFLVMQYRGKWGRWYLQCYIILSSYNKWQCSSSMSNCYYYYFNVIYCILNCLLCDVCITQLI